MNDKVITEFQRLMGELPQQGLQDTTELLLRLMDPERARALRACAIPHTFNDQIMTAMLPELDPPRADAFCEEFAKLSLVMPDLDGWGLHDRARKELFRKWLDPDRREEFSLISSRLAAFFEGMTAEAKEQTLEQAKKLRMFHLVGANQRTGFAEFEALCRRARSQFRLSECATLLRLVHEYDPILTPEHTLRLAYHEGKLNSDLHQWEQAEPLFTTILESASVPTELRVKALVRLGYLKCQKRLWPEAVEYYLKALALARETPETEDKVCRITHDLGAAYRETGDLVQAERLLQQSLVLSREGKDNTGMALNYNSLGMLQLKRGDVQSAIDAFHKSLECLEKGGQTFRTAQVLNNLGLAYGQRAEWQMSEQYYLQSLEIKRQAGDSLGQAFALNNLARTQVNQDKLEQAVASLTEAISLFEQMHDQFNLAVARHNRGKLYRRLRSQELCKADFEECIRLFQLCDRADEASGVQEDLDALTRKKKLPWWAWAAIVLFPFLLLLFGLIASMAEK